LNEQVGVPRGKRAKLASKKVVPQSIGSADANSARDCLRRSAKVSANLKKFRFSPLCRGNDGLARACQDAPGRTSFDQLGFQFVLEGGELPRHGRMVHAQTPSGTENLTRAGDLQEYADTIPIHRLQFPRNKSAIVLVDVQTSTFHIGLVETRRLIVVTQSSALRTSGMNMNMHVDKLHHVTTITRVAEHLGEDEDWLRNVASDMEIEDGVIWVYGAGDDGVQAFTDFGIENLIELVRIYKENPTWLKRSQPE